QNSSNEAVSPTGGVRDGTPPVKRRAPREESRLRLRLPTSRAGFRSRGIWYEADPGRGVPAPRPGCSGRSARHTTPVRVPGGVRPRPCAAPAGLRVGDPPHEPLDERDLGLQQREPVLLLD